MEMMAAGDEAQGDPLRVGCGGQINQLHGIWTILKGDPGEKKDHQLCFAPIWPTRSRSPMHCNCMDIGHHKWEWPTKQ